MADIKIDQAWDRVTDLVTQLSEGELVSITRDGSRFFYDFPLNDHQVALWAISDSPRYCFSVDGVVGLRCNNIKATSVVIRMLCSRRKPWTGNEMWDDFEEDA
jgi:hypothetical protein